MNQDRTGIAIIYVVKAMGQRYGTVFELVKAALRVLPAQMVAIGNEA